MRQRRLFSGNLPAMFFDDLFRGIFIRQTIINLHIFLVSSWTKGNNTKVNSYLFDFRLIETGTSDANLGVRESALTALRIMASQSALLEVSSNRLNLLIRTLFGCNKL